MAESHENNVGRIQTCFLVHRLNHSAENGANETGRVGETRGKEKEREWIGQLGKDRSKRFPANLL